MVVFHECHRIDPKLDYSCKYQSHCEIRKFLVNDSNDVSEVLTLINSEKLRNETVKNKFIFRTKLIYFLLRSNRRSLKIAKNDYELLCMNTS